MLLISSTINTGYQRVPKIRVRNRRKALIYEDFSGMNMEFDYPIYYQELENAGIRNLMIEVDQESTAFEQIRTRLQTFKEIL